MAAGCDSAGSLAAAVAEANHAGRELYLRGGDSKAHLTGCGPGAPLATRSHTGIVDYRPDELVVTARCGTSLQELSTALAAEGQMLPFDPPRFGGGGTFGGAVAAGFSGPGRPWLGATRDAVLGANIVNGTGQRLAFGGQVLKNVAGYDVSRLMVGAFGTLGLLLEVTVRVQPRPEAVTTLASACSAEAAASTCQRLLRQPLPVTATCHVDGVLRVRVAGSEAGVRRACEALPLDVEEEGDAFFDAVRDHAQPFFAEAAATDVAAAEAAADHAGTPHAAAAEAGPTLWRLSLPRGAVFTETGALVEWAGAQAWWRTALDAEQVQARAQALGGFAAPFHGGGWPKRSASVRAAMQRIKAAFDPNGILNPHVMNDAH